MFVITRGALVGLSNMGGRMKALRVLAALLAVTILVSGCASKGNEQVASSVEEVGITQAEAQALWDGLATAYGGDDWGNRQSEVTSGSLAAFDVRSLMDNAWAEDIGSRVLAVNPDVMYDNTGEGQFPGYMEANAELRKDVHAALANATDADLIADAWTVWNTVEGEDAEYRIPNLPWQAFSVLTDAIVRPSTAATRVVSVEGTGTVLVTFKTNFTWSMDTDYDADWTNRYTVEKRDGKWVITGITNLGDYVVAVTESDLKRVVEAKATEPSKGELGEASGGAAIEWVGRDAQGDWYAAFKSGRGSWLMVQAAPNQWLDVGNLSMDGGYWVGGVAPADVIRQMEQAGLSVYE